MHKTLDELKVDLVPIPDLGIEDVLVEVKAAGICHSDINYRDGVAPVARFPITLGHEIAGVIAGRGKGVAGIEIGDRVCVHYVISCGKCEYCMSDRENYCERYRMIGKDEDGGFAEFVRVPSRNVLRIPDATPFEEAAILGCAVSTAFHALRRGRAMENETILVNGVGGLGLHAVLLASRVVRAGRVIAVDVSDRKLGLASRFGADSVVNSGEKGAEDRIRELTKGRFADLAMDFVGRRNTVEGVLHWVGQGGRLVVVGISPEAVTLSPYRTLIGKEIEIIGVNDHLRSELAHLIQLVDLGTLDLSHSVTHRLSIEEVNRGMQILHEQTENPVRVVISN